MEWTLTIDRDAGFLRVVTRGMADAQASEAMAQAVAGQMRQNRLTRALIDHRGIDGVSGTASGIYRRPTFFRLIGVLLGIRIAEIVKPEHVEHFKFLETVCLNRGFRFSVHFEEEPAVAWLLEE
jgi:hypothetical protein